MFPTTLDEAYVQRHARSGETWEQARHRLEGEVDHRYRHLPACEICAAGATSFEQAAETHRLGMCAATLEDWPVAALDKRLFDAAHAQSALHTRMLAALARNEVVSLMAHIKAQPHPINALTLACKTAGYLDACEQMGLFDRDELSAWKQEVFLLRRDAEAAFIRQYHERDPDALPWRAEKTAQP